MGCRGVEGGGGEHGGGGCDRAGSGGRGCDGSGGAGRRPKGIRTRVPVCRSIHQEAATQAGLRGRRLLISIADKEAVSEARAQTKKGPAFAGPLLSLGCHLLQQRHQQQRSEEHTSELQSIMRISYAVLCLKKKTCKTTT